MKKVVLLLLMVSLVGITGCRGQRSHQSPVHMNINMDFQPKYKAQALSWAPPEGTVVHTEKYDDGSRPETIPFDVTESLITRGEERFNIYCAVCHDRAGTGKGIVIDRGFTPAPNFSDARILEFTDGQIYDVIKDGVRNMPAYGKQIPENDRWAIVAYLRVLQKSRTTHVSELPAYMRSQIQ